MGLIPNSLFEFFQQGAVALVQLLFAGGATSAPIITTLVARGFMRF
jgi:hypothetical protein